MSECNIESHEHQKVKYICVDKKCTSSSRLGCADCFLDQHIPENENKHQRVLITQFQDKLFKNIDNIKDLKIDDINYNEDGFEDNFNCCLQKIIDRLNQYKVQLKNEIDQESNQLQEKVDEFNQQLSNFKVNDKKIYDLTKDELKKELIFYQESDSIIKKFEDQSKQLEQRKSFIQEKQQKVNQKLQNSINLMLKVFDDASETPQTPQTPQKPQEIQNNIPLSASSTTQSPPIKQIIEAARQKKGLKKRV